MADRKTSKNIGLVLKIVFFCVFISCLVFGIYLSSIANIINGDVKTEYIESWTVTDESGNSFETGKTYYDDRAYTEEFTIVSHLPDKIDIGSVLCFMNRSDVKVYIGGELRKEFVKMRDTGIPGGSLKEFYMQIPLETTDAGAEIKMVRGITDRNPIVVSETFVTSSWGVYCYMFDKYGMTFVLTVVLFIASLIATIIGIVLRFCLKQRIDMLYGALGILNVACWLLSVSQFTPLVTGLYFVDGFMGFLFCMMMPLGLMIYFNSIQNGRYNKLDTVLFFVTIANMIFWLIIHFTGVRSLQLSLVYIDSVLGIVILSVLATMLIDFKKGYIKEYKYTMTGFFVFMVFAIIEILKLIFFEQLTNELPMIIGLFALLTFVIIQQIDDLDKVRKGLEEEVHRKTVENEQMLIHIVQTLAGTIDAKDNYTKGHSSRVADYSKEIARRYGYDQNMQNDIYMLGLLHDIGKIGVPDAVINKPGKLTDEEYEVIKKHPVMGANILENIKEKSELSKGARWHHERYGGGGYPDGIKGDEIPEEARIIAVADAYDVMTSFRSYRDPMAQEKVRSEIEKGSGTQFDPRFAKIMLDMIAEDKNYDLREKKE